MTSLSQKINIQNKSRLYTVEFLRIFLTFFVILGHIMVACPEVKLVLKNKLKFEIDTHICVQFFFIIGGFFLYKQILSISNVRDLVKKIYIRLLPALLFIFLFCVILNTAKFVRFPAILSLTTGLSIPGQATGWGDWYVGVYFWCSLLFIGLFHNNIKQGFLWTGILTYLSLCLRLNVAYPGLSKTYYTIIGSDVIRGIYSMSIGIIASYLSDKIIISNKKTVKSFFTLFEIYCIIYIFIFIAYNNSHVSYSYYNRFNYLEIQIVFAILMISISNSFGYITQFLNSIEKIQKISRYSYSIFLGHIPFVSFVYKNHSTIGLSSINCALIIGGGGIIMGIFEYHFIEKKVAPWIINYFRKDVV